MSVVIASIVIPALASRDPNPSRGLRRAVISFAIFAALYVGYLIWIHPNAFVPHWP
jgi:hypothetical protein